MRFLNVLSLLSVSYSCHAFSSSPFGRATTRVAWVVPTKAETSVSSLHMAQDSVKSNRHRHQHDEWYMAAVAARDCAKSSTSTRSEVEEHLDKMLGIEAGCISGTVPETSDVCADPVWFAEIVDELRHKLGYSGPMEGYDAASSHESEG